MVSSLVEITPCFFGTDNCFLRSSARASLNIGLAFFSTHRWRIATNLCPKIASFQRLDLIHRDERTLVTFLLPSDNQTWINNRVKAPARRFISYRRASW